MANHIMTDGEAKEYARLSRLAAEVRMRATQHLPFDPDAGKMSPGALEGVRERLFCVGRELCVGGETAGWDAADKLIGPPGNDIPDSEMVEGAVRALVRRRPRSQDPWAAVAHVFALDRERAHALCRRFGIDPDGDAR